MATTYVIAEPCVDLEDRACVEECPVDCIDEGQRMLYIQPDECVDCGACEHGSRDETTSTHEHPPLVHSRARSA